MPDTKFSMVRPGAAAILVSPGPVDGYPPVQHQARMLADIGLEVEIITTALKWKDAVDFRHPRVRIRQVAPSGGRLRRLARFVTAIAAARYRLRSRRIAEIAYDPIGMLYSDLAPLRPNVRIGHLHECLQRFESFWVERRLRFAHKGYQKLVVADPEREKLITMQLGTSACQVVPNYPMAQSTPEIYKEPDGTEFEVVYCGSLGTDQKLDLVIASVPTWPKHARLTIIGNDRTPIAQALKAQAERLNVPERIRFEGWVAYEKLPARLAKASVGILLLDPRYEQFRTALGASNKRYQYMQAGLPQVGDQNPGVKELLEGEGIGLSVREHTVEELTRVVTQYTSDPARCRKEGLEARRLHLEQYNYQTVFMPVLEWIVDSIRTEHSRH